MSKYLTNKLGKPNIKSQITPAVDTSYASNYAANGKTLPNALTDGYGTYKSSVGNTQVEEPWSFREESAEQENLRSKLKEKKISYSDYLEELSSEGSVAAGGEGEKTASEPSGVTQEGGSPTPSGLKSTVDTSYGTNLKASGAAITASTPGTASVTGMSKKEFAQETLTGDYGTAVPEKTESEEAPAEEEENTEAPITENKTESTDGSDASASAPSYDEWLKLQESTRDASYREADEAYRRDYAEANASYAKNLAGYGANAERLASMGLTNSGYSDYLNASAYTQLREDIQTANAERNSAKQAADLSYQTNFATYTENQKAQESIKAQSFSTMAQDIQVGVYTSYDTLNEAISLAGFSDGQRETLINELRQFMVGQIAYSMSAGDIYTWGELEKLIGKELTEEQAKELWSNYNPHLDENGEFAYTASLSSSNEETNTNTYTINSKSVTVPKGYNPYTKTYNPDVAHGTFSNGYQPNNVDGNKLKESGAKTTVNGVEQNVWETEDGRLWVWDGTKNEYTRYINKRKQEKKEQYYERTYRTELIYNGSNGSGDLSRVEITVGGNKYYGSVGNTDSDVQKILEREDFMPDDAGALEYYNDRIFVLHKSGLWHELYFVDDEAFEAVRAAILRNN